ncbi:MAG TPA: L-seryl-tRNA(Sec) selenium transferase [Actinomycetota bacterium]|nr:L-seryl-tRNA(Sec) selenium transferase [Actinomycetota bacterium]
MGSDDLNARLRSLPSVDRIVTELGGAASPAVLVDVARRAIDHARHLVRDGAPAPTSAAIVTDARALLDAHRRRLLGPVINATGVLIHTNLGRVPLGEEQIDAIRAIATSYSNLEYELDSGTRGDRYSHARSLLTTLTGAESALVVNNNAAAVLLVLAGLCRDKEVIVSRGELIEIGGEFRLPDVMSASGARMVEVGTTNRTHLADYEKAITQNTAAILKVHPSNYSVVGFTASVAARELARLALGRGVCFIHDVGSGLIEPSGRGPLIEGEPSVNVALEDGADLVTFSGDKLLGGPQAGLILGRARLVERLAKHPLLRALRVDKLTLAALEATLQAYLDGDTYRLPLWRMALTPPEELERRARDLAERITLAVGDTVKAEAQATRAVAGGGSLPTTDLSSWGVSLTHPERSTASIERALRHGAVPVVCRIEDDRVVLDLRTVLPSQDENLANLVVVALQE